MRMKTIGLIGGMSWESSLEYYRILNQTAKERLGGFHSAKCIMYSFDFEEIETLQNQNKWEELGLLMIEAAKRVKYGGADFIMICTNTMHKFAEDIQADIDIPLLHIADATGEQVTKRGITTVGLLGTKFTMEEDFYTKRLEDQFHLKVVIPKDRERDDIHNIIYQELCQGILRLSSKERLRDIIDALVMRGAEGIILGCTEIPLLIGQEDVGIPIFDTTRIHAVSAIEYALE
jgi:aspartate racemase